MFIYHRLGAPAGRCRTDGALAGPAEPAGVTTDPPERPPAGGLLDALPLRRNAAVGLAVGGAVAAGAYAVRVLELAGPAPARGSPELFLSLAFVLGVTTAALVAALLTGAAAYRVLSEAPERPE